MHNISNQILFFDLIKYYAHSNYLMFKKICDLSYPDECNEIYFYSNMFLAANISGVIDVHYIDNSPIKWSSNIELYNDCIEIEGSRIKLIGTKSSWFQDTRAKIKPIVYGLNDSPLFLGSILLSNENDIDTNCFNTYIELMESKRSEIESMICSETAIEMQDDLEVKIFDNATHRWEQLVLSDLKNPSLLQIKRRFSNTVYYLAYPELSIFFRVKFPEWMFVLAFRHFGWDTSAHITYDAGRLTINRNIIIPTLLMRYLLKNSEYVKISNRLEFVNIMQVHVNLFMSFFVKGGYLK